MRSSFRKLFLDSRHRVSGTHGDFTIELPQSVDCTRTSSVYLASCSVSNDFDTIIQGVNSNLYVLSQDAVSAPDVTLLNNRFYFQFTKDRNITITSQKLYWLYASTAGVGNPYGLTVAPITPGVYTVEAFAAVLQGALSSNATVTWVELTKSYAITWSNPGNTSYWIPAQGDIDAAVTALKPTILGTYVPGDTNTLNGLLDMPSIPSGQTRDQQFGVSAATGPVNYTTPVTSVIAPLNLSLKPSFASVAALLQGAISSYLPGATVTTANRQFTFTSGSPTHGLYIPTDAQIKSNWSGWTGQPYGVPNDYNFVLPLTAGTFSTSITTGPLPPTTQSHILPLTPAYYDAVSGLASALQTAIQTVDPAATVVSDNNLGTLTITSTLLLQFPTDEELRSPAWQAMNWNVYPGPSYSVLDPQSINDQLYLPPSSLGTSLTTSSLDLLPYRELYLASSISNYRTLQSGSGALDILARIPLDQPWGSVVSFRHLGPSDALSASDVHFKTIAFQFRDYRGRVVFLRQPAIIELVFLDSDPYAM